MAVSMPAILILVLCRTVASYDPSSDVDQVNSSFTKHVPREWAYEGSMMVCRTEVVALEDSALVAASPKSPADARPYTINDCQRAGIMEGSKWNVTHASSKYRWWRTTCPAPIKNYGADGIKGTRDDEIVGWQKNPGCGHRDTVKCEPTASEI